MEPLSRDRRGVAKTSRRARIAQALDVVGVLDRLLELRARLGLGLLTVVTYHRVAKPSEIGDLDDGVVEVTPGDLAEHLAVVKAHATVVTMREVHASRAGARLPPNPVLITFDDGYLDNHDVALPILARAGVPATFFIPTAFPDGGKLFWWDRVAVILKRSRRSSIDLAYPERVTLDMSAIDRAISKVHALFKQTPGLDADRFWVELEGAAGVTLSAAEERALARRAIMGWGHVRALRDAGMDVQSHSHTHRVLGTIPPDEALRDLVRSREVLRERLGEVPRAIAYPVGKELTGAHRDVARAAGFDLAFTNGTGIATRRSDPMHLPRVSLDRSAVGALYKLLLLAGEQPSWRRVVRGSRSPGSAVWRLFSRGFGLPAETGSSG